MKDHCRSGIGPAHFTLLLALLAGCGDQATGSEQADHPTAQDSSVRDSLADAEVIHPEATDATAPASGDEGYSRDAYAPIDGAIGDLVVASPADVVQSDVPGDVWPPVDKGDAGSGSERGDALDSAQVDVQQQDAKDLEIENTLDSSTDSNESDGGLDSLDSAAPSLDSNESARDSDSVDAPSDSWPMACASALDAGEQQRIRYATEAVPYGHSCQSEVQIRTCQNGAWSEWSGAYEYETCRALDPKCGNGVQEGPEACDDGNMISGDGCISDCSTVEPGFYCANEPGKPTVCLRCRVRVDGASTATVPNGETWATAFSDLQAGLERARELAKPGRCDAVEVWVVQGTYRPGPAGARDAAFELANRVLILGGFSGKEETISTRDWNAHPTILSGDLKKSGDLNAADNARHVVVADNVDSTAVVNGVTIEGGHGDCSFRREDEGGGIYVLGGSPQIEHVIVRHNYSCSGGGMGISGDAHVEDASVADNNAGTMSNGGRGGGVLASGGSFVNVTFERNSAWGDGGGMNSYNPSRLSKLAFANNQARGDGGGLHVQKWQTLTIEDASFTSNSVDLVDGSGQGGGLWTASSDARLRNVTFVQNVAKHCGGVLANGPMTMLHCAFTGNQARRIETGYGGGGVCLNGTPLDLNDVRFESNTSDGEGGAILSLAGNTVQLQNVLFVSNRASGHGGAVNARAIVGANILFANNSADKGGAIYLARETSSDSTPSVLTNATFADNAAMTSGPALFVDTALPSSIVNSILWGSSGEVGGSAARISYSCMRGGMRSGDDNGNNLSECGSAPGGSPFVNSVDDPFHLAPGSAAVDSGDDGAPGLVGVSTDLAGNPRFVGRVDLGAYERAP